MPESPPASPALHARGWSGTGWVILAFDPRATPPADLGELRARLADPPYGLALGERAVWPLLPDVDRDALRALEEDLAPAWAPALRLGECWRIWAGDDPALLARLARLAWEPGPVVASWAERSVDPGGPSPRIVGIAQQQTHLETLGATGPGGLWARPRMAKGADGSLARLVDVELGWRTDHQDLAGAPGRLALLAGTNIQDAAAWLSDPAQRAEREAAVAHGTAVLGLLGALDDGAGVLGVAHGLARIGLASWWTPGGPDPAGLFIGAQAVLLPILQGFLRPGDVILLQMQTRAALHPIETMLDMLLAIHLATAAGVVVVEAAGNAGVDLGRVWSDASFRAANGAPRVLGFHMAPGPDAIDSGAVMVGACYTAGSQLLRKDDSSFGARVDAYGPGRALVTTDSASPSAWRSDFGSTSGASALVAGVMLAVQSARRARRRLPYDAATWRRTLLADPTCGAPVIDGGQPCGRCPRLPALMDRALK